jgi:hypothetical protein
MMMQEMITHAASDENKNKNNIHVFNLYFCKQLLPTFETSNILRSIKVVSIDRRVCSVGPQCQECSYRAADFVWEAVALCHYILTDCCLAITPFRNISAVGGDTSKGLLLPFFDGEPSKLKGWWMRFKSYATIKKTSQTIQRVAEKDLPANEATDASSDKTKKAARYRNRMAISCLTMAFQDDALLNMIEQSETSDWPSGLAYRVVDELFKKYRPVDIISRVDMRTRLSQVSMKSDDDPRVLFKQLHKTRTITLRRRLIHST